MKQYLFLFYFFAFAAIISASAQDTQVKLNALPLAPPKDTIDYAGLRCMYRQLVMDDTLKPQKLRENFMLLQTGHSVSKYFNYTDFYSDSLFSAEFKKNPEQDVIALILSNPVKPNNEFLQLFKNYPARKNTSINNIFTDKYIFEEDSPRN